MKYLGVKLTKRVQDLKTENYKTVLKEIKELLNNWNDISQSWVRRHNIAKMSIWSNLLI